MSPLFRRLLLVLVALLVPGLVSAQGLGDAAAREKQKRKANPNAGKARTITNDDLKKEEDGKTKSDSGTSGASPTLDSSPASGSSQAQRETSRSTEASGDSQATAVDRAQSQVDSARSAVVAAEAHVKELSDKLNPMSPSFVYGQPNAADPTGEEMRTREALKGAQAELDAARANLVKATRDLEDVRQGRTPSKER
jgi:hypothetical protein